MWRECGSQWLEGDVGLVGYEENMSTETVTGVIQLLLQKGAEWGHIEKISILQGDIKKAYDFLKPKHLSLIHI